MATAAAQETFTFDTLRRRAKDLAAREHVAPRVDDVPEWLARLDFDGYRRIRPRAESALWAGDDLPFRVQFSHRGYLFSPRVAMHVVDGANAAELRFDARQFHYDDPRGDVPASLGYAGLAVLYRFAGEQTWHEVASFRGASYFRLLGRGQRYGASARALAIDPTAAAGEEHPAFVEMWLRKPTHDAASLELFGLLDGPSTTGAFRIVITPGESTTAAVDACLYPRRALPKIGLAPLSSMFLHDEQRRRQVNDYRPEVHDSDGLLFADASGDRSWRPLVNPERAHRVSTWPLPDPAGFGLSQRDRSFASYRDLEDRFELRPSYWVTPRGGWGPGKIELLEIPSPTPYNDNVACYWVPDDAPGPGREMSFAYTVSAGLEEPGRPPLGRARHTFVQRGAAADRFLVDFDGPELGDEPSHLRAEVHCTRGRVCHLVLQRNDAAGGMRCAFDVTELGDASTELRASLWRDRRKVSETWVLPWRRD